MEGEARHPLKKESFQCPPHPSFGGVAPLDYPFGTHIWILVRFLLVLFGGGGGSCENSIMNIVGRGRDIVVVLSLSYVSLPLMSLPLSFASCAPRFHIQQHRDTNA